VNKKVTNMTKVAILPVSTATGEITYQAVAGDKQSEGKTAGEALDALTMQLPNDEAETLIVIQRLRPDHFFDAKQQQRLTDLMARWRAVRDTGASLPQIEQNELEALVEAEVRASADRTVALLQALGQ
jgi:hypothetical protein